MTKPAGLCSVADCDRQSQASRGGMCIKHFKEGGVPVRKCTAPNCTRQSYAEKNLCIVHFNPDRYKCRDPSCQTSRLNSLEYCGKHKPNRRIRTTFPAATYTATPAYPALGNGDESPSNVDLLSAENISDVATLRQLLVAARQELTEYQAAFSNQKKNIQQLRLQLEQASIPSTTRNEQRQALTRAHSDL